jgi:RsmE family RNA methyltransferase
MNIVLFHSQELAAGKIPLTDRRARHVQHVLKRREGDTFDAGVIGGDRGKALLLTHDPAFLYFQFQPTHPPADLWPITVLTGLVRPVHGQRLVRELSTLGVSAIWLVKARKGEASYADSTLYHPENLQQLLVEGAEQAFVTQIPELLHMPSLEAALAAIPNSVQKIVLDNYESPAPLSEVAQTIDPLLLAIGPERGWHQNERENFRLQGFSFAHLGQRVLKTETACLAAVSVALAKRGVY